MFWHHTLADFANGYRGKAHALNETLPDFLLTKTHDKIICSKIGSISKIALFSRLQIRAKSCSEVVVYCIPALMSAF